MLMHEPKPVQNKSTVRGAHYYTATEISNMELLVFGPLAPRPYLGHLTGQACYPLSSLPNHFQVICDAIQILLSFFE
jgi:hypothetical protein